MANLNLNKAIIAGRITAEPELKSTPSGISVTSFTVAVNRSYRAKNGEQPQADFINVTAWRQTAEFITRNFHKASSICIVGSIQTRSYTDKQGQKRYATEVVADAADFVDSKAAADNSRTVYILADHSKFGQVSAITFTQLGRVNIITDKLQDKKYLQK